MVSESMARTTTSCGDALGDPELHLGRGPGRGTPVRRCSRRGPWSRPDPVRRRRGGGASRPSRRLRPADVEGHVGSAGPGHGDELGPTGHGNGGDGPALEGPVGHRGRALVELPAGSAGRRRGQRRPAATAARSVSTRTESRARRSGWGEAIRLLYPAAANRGVRPGRPLRLAGEAEDPLGDDVPVDLGGAAGDRQRARARGGRRPTARRARAGRGRRRRCRPRACSTRAQASLITLPSAPGLLRRRASRRASAWPSSSSSRASV